MRDRTLTEQLEDLNNKEYSSVELTTHYLDAITSNSELNCFITVTADKALEEAGTADRARAAGVDKPLLGIPIAHKDIFLTEGVRTTAGSKMLDNFIAPFNATVVENLEAAGAVTLGKANMDEFAMGSSNENSYYGSVKNPWDTSRVSGGSSGGSAAAVAARLCSAATGTDTGGSIRQPAAFCGVTGLKPTYGRISRWGIIAYASSLDQAGVMARTAQDCALMLTAMASHDDKDSTSSTEPSFDYVEDLGRPLENLKIGICTEYRQGLDPDVGKILDDVCEVFVAQGATLREISLPNTHLAIPAYYIIAPAECSANLSRYDGVRFGYRCADPVNLDDLYKRSRSEGLGKEVKSRIMVGAFALSAGYYDAYYRKAQQIRRLIKNDFLSAFEDVDLILGPTTPGEAFKIGEKSDDPVAMYLQDIYTISSNLAGLPAISFPAGFKNGLPIGAQLTGRYFEEMRLLNAVHQFQQASTWHQKAPGVNT